MKNPIRHDGIVEATRPGHVLVRIVQASACAACRVAAHCATAEAAEKVVDVAVADASRWQAGQQVVVATEGTMAGRALLIAFGLPLALMLVVLGVAVAAGCGEGATALLMVGVLVPYYIFVWLCRHRIARTIAFRIEDTN